MFTRMLRVPAHGAYQPERGRQAAGVEGGAQFDPVGAAFLCGEGRLQIAGANFENGHGGCFWGVRYGACCSGFFFPPKPEICKTFAAMTTAPLKTFIIYARADAAFKDELLTHLHGFVENALIEKWVDSDLLPGEEWEKRIERELEAAHLVLMLVSADALKSEFIRKKELKTALEKKRAGNARVVPILVRDFFWELHADLAELQFLPKDENGKVQGVAAWISRDSAWTSVCKELFALIRDIRAGLEKEAAELARRAAEEAEKQREQTEREKAERARHRRDEAFWKTLLADASASDDPAPQDRPVRILPARPGASQPPRRGRRRRGRNTGRT
jgi:hypothetical protein